MKFKLFILIFSCVAILLSCKNKENSSSTFDTDTVDAKLVSLYPINNQYLELQNLEFVENIDESRNFKNTTALKNNLKTTLYKKWCENGECYQLNEYHIVEKSSENNSNNIKAAPSDINFIIPSSHGIVSVTSLPNENIFTIKLWDQQLSEKWSTIYERSKLDSNNELVQYAEVLGYNDELLVFHSSNSEIPKSGYVLIKNGFKKQEEYQWSGMLIDEDNSTVLGQIIQNNDLSYSIRIGNTMSELPNSVTGYSKSNSFIQGNKIILGFYHSKSDILKIITIDYQTGNIIWEYAISSAKLMDNVLFSGFEDQFIIEIVTTNKNSLYILNKENGQLMGKF